MSLQLLVTMLPKGQVGNSQSEIEPQKGAAHWSFEPEAPKGSAGELECLDVLATKPSETALIWSPFSAFSNDAAQGQPQIFKRRQRQNWGWRVISFVLLTWG